MNKNAKEMFEKLGYEKTNSNLLTYRSDDGGYIEQIMFSEVGHRIIFREWEEYNNYQPQGQFTVYMDLLQAINQQCKELGWLDDKKKEINYQKPFAIKYMLDNKRLYGTEWYCKLKCLERSDK